MGQGNTNNEEIVANWWEGKESTQNAWLDLLKLDYRKALLTLLELNTNWKKRKKTLRCEDVYLALVHKNVLTIECIENPSEAVQLAAIKQNWRAIRYIKNPSEKIQELVAQKIIESYSI